MKRCQCKHHLLLLMQKCQFSLQVQEAHVLDLYFGTKTVIVQDGVIAHISSALSLLTQGAHRVE